MSTKLNELLIQEQNKQAEIDGLHDAISKLQKELGRKRAECDDLRHQQDRLLWVRVDYTDVRDRVYHHRWYGGYRASYHYGEKDWSKWQVFKPRRAVQLEVISFSEKMTCAEAIARLEAEGYVLEDVFVLCAFRDKYFPKLKDEYLSQEKDFRMRGGFGGVIAGNVEGEVAALEVSYAGNSREMHYFPVIYRRNASQMITENDKFLVSRKEEE